MTAMFQNEVFQNETKAREALEAVRWPNGPVCPHCKNSDQERIGKVGGKSHRPGLFYCHSCEGQFTVTVGTVFERSKIPLTKWWMAAHMLSSAKNGCSAHEIHRALKVTYKTAWFMMHRLREAMIETNPEPMGGKGKSVQSDETYYGNTSRRAKGYKKNRSRKQQVVALVDKEAGKVRAFHVKRATAVGVREILVKNVSRKSKLHTDESRLYTEVGKEFAKHETVEHGWNRRGYYVGKNGQTTNNVENFFGVFKRGMRGTYVFCSEQHLARYLSEFQFRYNNRAGLGVSDGERTAIALKGIEGKRLTYRPSN